MAVAVENVQVFILAENRLLREALTRILSKKSDIRVVGASAFSPQVVEQIAAAVRCVASAEAVCPPQLCLVLFEQMAQQARIPSFHIRAELGLTRREQQLVQMIGRGLTNKEIATQLNLSEQTVKNHVHRMLRKVGASDRLAAVELCRSQGIFT